MRHDDVAFVAEQAMGDRATEGDDGLAQADLDLDGEDLRPEFENVLRARFQRADHVGRTLNSFYRSPPRA